MPTWKMTAFKASFRLLLEAYHVSTVWLLRLLSIRWSAAVSFLLCLAVYAMLTCLQYLRLSSVTASALGGELWREIARAFSAKANTFWPFLGRATTGRGHAGPRTRSQASDAYRLQSRRPGHLSLPGRNGEAEKWAMTLTRAHCSAACVVATRAVESEPKVQAPASGI